MKKFLYFIASCSLLVHSTLFAYTGTKEMVIRQRENTKLHIIAYYKVMVVLNITERPFAVSNVQCGVFPLDEKTQTSTFGQNKIVFSKGDYGYINGRQHAYVEDLTHVTLYRTQCNNFVVKKN
jgi:hypothetical protein